MIRLVDQVIKVVLDTNVLISGFTFAASPPGEVVDAWRAGLFELVTSAPIFAEVERTLVKPYFQKRLRTRQVRASLQLLREASTHIEIAASVEGIATHAEDDLILATAVSGEADYLVTGDRQLLKLGSYQGVQIVSPAGFLDKLRGPVLEPQSGGPEADEDD